MYVYNIIIMYLRTYRIYSWCTRNNVVVVVLCVAAGVFKNIFLLPKSLVGWLLRVENQNRAGKPNGEMQMVRIFYTRIGLRAPCCQNWIYIRRGIYYIICTLVVSTFRISIYRDSSIKYNIIYTYIV